MKQRKATLSFLLLLGSVIGLSAVLLVPGQPCAQQIDLDEAANAKAAAGRDALAHFPPDAAASVGTFIKFDVPGAPNGTDPVAINAAGVITGHYIDANGSTHGFLRGPFGGFQTFDAPGAANGTTPTAINAAGTVAGTFSDANSVTHGFVRTAWGGFTTYEISGAANFTFAEAIDDAGEVTGLFLDANFVGHGFLKEARGAVVTFDVPGAGGATNFPQQGTFPKAIGADGAIVGLYVDANTLGHGFIRSRRGAVATFDPPGNMNLFGGIPFVVNFAQNMYINPRGIITGKYFETIPGNFEGGNWRVFVRNEDGTFTTFDAANYPPCCIWSFPSGITPDGTITGTFNDGATMNHGFVRYRDGSVTTFDVPGASTGFNLGTSALGITPGGEIMGEYFDASRIPHGFVLLPNPKIYQNQVVAGGTP